jgi:hypothetical protein
MLGYLIMQGVGQTKSKATKNKVVGAKNQKTKKRNSETSIVLRFAEGGRKTKSVTIKFLSEPGNKSAKFISEVIDNQIRYGALLEKPAGRARGKKLAELIPDVIDDMGIDRSRKSARKTKKETAGKGETVS